VFDVHLCPICGIYDFIDKEVLSVLSQLHCTPEKCV
jgi:hypothetical protein